jgi:hypothetical protein
MCDRTHPQDRFERTTFNHLVDGVLYTPPLRDAYLRRLLTLTDKYSASGWLEREIRATAAFIGADAREDMRLWALPGSFDSNVEALVAQVKTRRGQLYDQLKGVKL